MNEDAEYKVRYVNERTALIQKGPVKIPVHFSSEALELIGYPLKTVVENPEGYEGFEKFMRSLPDGGMRIIEAGDCFEVIKKEEFETESIDKMLLRERPSEKIPIIDKEAIPEKLRTRRRRDSSSIMRLNELFGHEEPESVCETEYNDEPDDNKY